MATAKNICPREDGLDNLGRKEKAWGNVYAKNLHVTGSVELPVDFVNDILAKKLLPKVTITTLSGSTVTATNGTSALNSTETGSTGKFSFEIPSLGKWTFTATKTGAKAFTRSVVVDVEEIKEYKVEIAHGVRYGYRVKKDEGNPYGRVEYLFDAVGLTPAKMNFTTGAFDYGSWGDKWFVTKNKPCMVKSNGQIDYYLNPNNYALKENGTTSDVANVNYDGNAMAQIPLVWVSRYEKDGYEYEIISDIQYDDTYKAYAHTREDGTIADYFLYSMFGGSGGTAKMRSLSGQSLAYDLTAEQEITGCKANGAGWFIHTWSQRQLIRTLLVLVGKSTDTQAVATPTRRVQRALKKRLKSCWMHWTRWDTVRPIWASGLTWKPLKYLLLIRKTSPPSAAPSSRHAMRKAIRRESMPTSPRWKPSSEWKILQTTSPTGAPSTGRASAASTIATRATFSRAGSGPIAITSAERITT